MISRADVDRCPPHPVLMWLAATIVKVMELGYRPQSIHLRPEVMHALMEPLTLFDIEVVMDPDLDAQAGIELESMVLSDD